MQIELSAEVLLKQLKLSVSEKNLKQMQRIIANTKNIKQFYKHLFAFNDQLVALDAFIAPSSSVDALKIKYHGTDGLHKEDFHKAVAHFCEKYKVDIEPVSGKETYYIRGSRAA